MNEQKQTEPLKAVEWQFPLGGCTARLSIVASEGHKIEVEDIDALAEMASLIKRQLERRQSPAGFTDEDRAEMAAGTFEREEPQNKPACGGVAPHDAWVLH